MIKKTISTFVLLVIMACSNNVKSTKVYNRFDLNTEYKNVNEKDKAKFYVKYLKAIEIENLKKNDDFKKFSDNILNQFVDKLYHDEPITEDMDFDTLTYNQTMKKVDSAINNNQKPDYVDLRTIYNPFTYSGMEVYDIEAKGNLITFTTSSGAKMGTYYHKFKVKGDKLIELDVYQNEN